MHRPSISIVLEWDNAGGLSREKASYFLRRLARTVRESTAAIPEHKWRAVTGILEMTAKYLRRFFTVGLTRVTPSNALPVFLGGLSFVGVTAASQLIASLTRRPGGISTDHSSIIASSRVLAEEPAAGRTIAA